MREIKFRSWNEIKNKFFYSQNGRYYSDENCKNIISERVCSEFDWSNAEEFIGNTNAMQDVYEGDVMEGNFGTGLGGKSTKYKMLRFTLKWFEDRYIIAHGRELGRYRFHPFWFACNVIGNIHDNPELLNN